MNHAYSNELRTDTAVLLLPLISGAMALGLLILALTLSTFAQSWYLWLGISVAAMSGVAGWHYLKNDQTITGSLIFIVSHLFILFMLILKNWEPGSAIPYLFAILIITSSMFTQPDHGFITWGAATLLTAIGISTHINGTWPLIQQIAAPIVVNLFIATAAFFSAIEWQTAVESVSSLHIKAQQRRDELFAIQEALSSANGRLHSTNEALEKARTTAIAERDLRTRFMNQVSHELRTPMNTIVNFAHILGKGELGSINEQQFDYLERIEKSGWHSVSVLNDLLDLAQMNAGEFLLRKEPIDLKSVCEDAMSSVRSLLHNPDIAIVRDYPKKWPPVLADRKRLHQALLNLLGNAAKYTDQGHIALRVRVHQYTITFAVEDTGIGIPEKHHDTIFQEFRQLNETMGRRRVGTGLGLPISRHLIEQHGGTLTVSSKPNQGSTFTITLPIETENKHTDDTLSTNEPILQPIATERPF